MAARPAGPSMSAQVKTDKGIACLAEYLAHMLIAPGMLPQAVHQRNSRLWASIGLPTLCVEPDALRVGPIHFESLHSKSPSDSVPISRMPVGYPMLNV